MEDINIVGQEDTPTIVLDKAAGTLVFSGTSAPEDATMFFQPIIDWLAQYPSDPLQDITFIFRMQYFNSATSTILFRIVCMIDDIKSKGINAKIEWYFDELDKEMKYFGEDFEEILQFASIDLKTYEN